MVRALLAGTKSQTRRALRPQSAAGEAPSLSSHANPFGQPGDRLWVRETYAAFGHWEQRHDAGKNRDAWYFIDETKPAGLAYRYDHEAADVTGTRRAGAPSAWHKRPALFMPRAASRILLGIADVRVEHLQAVSAGDAVAEGIVRVGEAYALIGSDETTCDPVQAYRSVWESINGAGSWAADPWVWVVAFTAIRV
jgi:hypothetical protein